MDLKFLVDGFWFTVLAKDFIQPLLEPYFYQD